VIEEAIVDIDDDRSRALASRIGHRLRPQLGLHAVAVDEGDRMRVVRHRADVPAGHVVGAARHDVRVRPHRVAGGERSGGKTAEKESS
jgi:hypothetical protein